MKTYNSQNLPLEHFIKNGRNILHYTFKVKDTKAKPANPNSPNAIDQWNDYEAGTFHLDDSVIEDIVKTVNRLNIPAIIDIEFDLGRNAGMTPIKLPILPAVVEKNISDPLFVQRYVDYYDDKRAEQLPAPAGVTDLEYTPLDLAEERKKIPSIDVIEKNQVYLVKEQIRRSILTDYLYALSRVETDRSQIPVLDFICGLNIINEHYNLSEIDPEFVHFERLASVSKKASGPRTPDAAYPEAVYDFSIELQKKKLKTGTPDIYCLKTPGYHIIGLNKGKSPEDVARIARIDRLVAERITYMTAAESIIDQYKRYAPKNPADRLPKQPGSN